jgi:hypothetical protein
VECDPEENDGMNQGDQGALAIGEDREVHRDGQVSPAGRGFGCDVSHLRL